MSYAVATGACHSDIAWKPKTQVTLIKIREALLRLSPHFHPSPVRFHHRWFLWAQGCSATADQGKMCLRWEDLPSRTNELLGKLLTSFELVANPDMCYYPGLSSLCSICVGLKVRKLHFSFLLYLRLPIVPATVGAWSPSASCLPSFIVISRCDRHGYYFSRIFLLYLSSLKSSLHFPTQNQIGPHKLSMGRQTEALFSFSKLMTNVSFYSEETIFLSVGRWMDLTCQHFAEVVCGFLGQFLAFWGREGGESLSYFLTLVAEELELEN